jgi:hypothetical protein
MYLFAKLWYASVKHADHISAAGESIVLGQCCVKVYIFLTQQLQSTLVRSHGELQIHEG